MMTYYIYTLNDSDSGEVRYVGYTKNPQKRYQRHLKAAKENIKWPVYNWINKILSQGKKPVMVIIETGFGDWDQREKFWISHYRKIKNNLLNVCDGGHFNPPPEARKRAGKKLKNRFFSAEHRRKISEAKKGCKRPDAAAQCLKMAARNKGKKMFLSDAERKRRADSCKKISRWK